MSIGKRHPLIIELETIYTRVGNEWVWKHGPVLDLAVGDGPLILCGSVGGSLSGGCAVAQPGDIDFVTLSHQQALLAVSELSDALCKYKSWFKILVNSHTEFVPEGATHHFRFLTTGDLWLPICIFVVPEAKYWFNDQAAKIQLRSDMQTAAKKQTKKDGKQRSWSLDVDLSDEPLPPEPSHEPPFTDHPFHEAENLTGGWSPPSERKYHE